MAHYDGTPSKSVPMLRYEAIALEPDTPAPKGLPEQARRIRIRQSDGRMTIAAT